MNALQVSTPTGPAGALVREADCYQFAYASQADARSAVSLTMPVRRLAFTSASLQPIFQMNQPEGFLRERLHHLLTKSNTELITVGHDTLAEYHDLAAAVPGLVQSLAQGIVAFRWSFPAAGT